MTARTLGRKRTRRPIVRKHASVFPPRGLARQYGSSPSLDDRTRDDQIPRPLHPLSSPDNTRLRSLLYGTRDPVYVYDTPQFVNQAAGPGLSGPDAHHNCHRLGGQALVDPRFTHSQLFPMNPPPYNASATTQGAKDYEFQQMRQELCDMNSRSRNGQRCPGNGSRIARNAERPLHERDHTFPRFEPRQDHNPEVQRNN
ncbi:unnamed protein product [Cochlearia groenlandica]